MRFKRGDEVSLVEDVTYSGKTLKAFSKGRINRTTGLAAKSYRVDFFEYPYHDTEGRVIDEIDLELTTVIQSPLWTALR